MEHPPPPPPPPLPPPPRLSTTSARAFQLLFALYLLQSALAIIHAFLLLRGGLYDASSFQSYCQAKLKSPSEQCGIQGVLSALVFIFFFIDMNTHISAAVLCLFGFTAARQPSNVAIKKLANFFRLQIVSDFGSFLFESSLHYLSYQFFEKPILSYTSQQKYSEQNYTWGSPRSRVEFVKSHLGLGGLLWVLLAFSFLYFLIWLSVRSLRKIIIPRLGSGGGQQSGDYQYHELKELEERKCKKT